jgi:hypothetical protein
MKIPTKKYKTPIGVVAACDIVDYAIAESINSAYSAYDLYISFEIPESRNETGLHRELAEIILPNFVPDDYNHFSRDQWNYSTESHYTTEEIDEDMTTQEWLEGYVDCIDIINELKIIPKESIINLND